MPSSSPSCWVSPQSLQPVEASQAAARAAAAAAAAAEEQGTSLQPSGEQPRRRRGWIRLRRGLRVSERRHGSCSARPRLQGCCAKGNRKNCQRPLWESDSYVENTLYTWPLICTIKRRTQVEPSSFGGSPPILWKRNGSHPCFHGSPMILLHLRSAGPEERGGRRPASPG